MSVYDKIELRGITVARYCGLAQAVGEADAPGLPHGSVVVTFMSQRDMITFFKSQPDDCYIVGGRAMRFSEIERQFLPNVTQIFPTVGDEVYNSDARRLAGIMGR